MQSNEMLKTDHQKRVEVFMMQAGQAVPLGPVIPDEETRLLRAKLILEEALETVNALGFVVTVPAGGCTYNEGISADDYDLRTYKIGLCGMEEEQKPNLIEIADGCADISVVTTGTLSACGISDTPLLREVDESNLRKFGPGGRRREDGKWLKPSDWQKPNIPQVLIDQAHSSDAS